jgi:hypothetical protein
VAIDDNLRTIVDFHLHLHDQKVLALCGTIMPALHCIVTRRLRARSATESMLQKSQGLSKQLRM